MKSRRDGQLCRSEPHRLFRRFGIDAVDLEKDASRLDLRHPIFGRPLAGAHAHFGGLLRHGDVGEHADPHAARALHVAGDRTAGGFDLARGDALGLCRLQSESAEIERGSTLGRAMDAALVLFAEFRAFGLQHDLYPLLRCRGALRPAAIGIGSFRLAAFRRHRVVLHDLALEDPDLHAAGAVGGFRRRYAIIDVCA